jgi:glutamyl-tRNA synthetase
VRGRFAPTPSGDLHLGGARTALCAWLQVRAAGGTFVLRVEDLDRPRAVPGAEARILEDLRWLGLDWDEGPDRSGPHAPYRQSERTARYQAALERLREAGRAFPCFCSRADVERASQAPHGPSDEGPRYPGTCRGRPAASPVGPAPTRPPSFRLRVDEAPVRWVDGIHGGREEQVDTTVGDFVLRRSGGIFAYQLAVVVDDAAMEITHVLRGDDLLSSTARQLVLYEALGLRPPTFAHVPLVLGPDGTRLSKRHGAIAVRALRERGEPAHAIVGRLAASLGLCPEGEALTPAALVPRFELAQLPKAPSVLALS